MNNLNRFGKKGESTPITVILLVLIALVLIVIIWNLIMGLIIKNTETQELQASMMIVNMDIDDIAADNFTEPQYVNITLKRGGGQDILVNRTEIKKYTDIVFIIDSTSSMGPQITETYNIINSFVNTLVINKINYTLALVEYKDIPYFYASYYQQGIDTDFEYRVHNFTTTDPNPNIVSNFTVNADEFRSKLILIRDNIQNGSGGDKPESMLEAINVSTKLNFRNIPTTSSTIYKKMFVVVADGPPHAYDCTCDYTWGTLKCYQQSVSGSHYEVLYYDKYRGSFRITNNHSSTQYYPSMGNNSVLWTDYRNSNYDIYMCNLSSTTPSTDLVQWCSNSPGLNRVSSNGLNEYYPYSNEDDSIITWLTESGSTRTYKICDLNGKGENSIQSWCSSAGLKTISNTPGIPSERNDISNNRLVYYKYIGGGTSVNNYGRNDSTGNADVYLYDPAISPNEIKVTNDPNITLNKTQSPLNPQTPLYNYSQSYPRSPRISGNRIVWQECRNSTGGLDFCNYEIYLCDINGASLVSDIETFCRNDITSGGKVMRITNHARNQLYPDIDGDIIAWTDYRNDSSYGAIYLCNLSGKTNIQIPNWCQGDGKIVVAYESGGRYNLYPSVSGDVISWWGTRSGYRNFLCNFSERGLDHIRDWCRDTNKGLKILNDYNYSFGSAKINGERASWYEYIVPAAIPYNLTYLAYGKTWYVLNMSIFLNSNNFTLYYINNFNEGTCKNKTDVAMATSSGGNFYSYIDATKQMQSISEALLDEINEYFRKDIYDHINIIFYNATKNYIMQIDDIPRPLESKKYSIPKQGSLAGNITNITMIEVYIASYTRESRREVIGPLLSKWVRRD